MKANQIFILSLCAAAGLVSCNDEFEGQNFVTPTHVESEMTCTTLMENHEEDFSLWLQLLKYADYYNGLKDASSTSTVFAPTNAAVEKFLAWRGVSSIDELGKSYARSVCQVHILNGTKLDSEEFINTANDGDKLTVQNLFSQYLVPTYGHVETEIDDAYRTNDTINPMTLYINNQAAVQPRDSGGINYLVASNSIIYYLDDVIHPLVETIVDKLEQQGEYTIFAAACRESGYAEVLSHVIDTISLLGGGKETLRREFTCFAPTDAAMKEAGILSVADLKAKVGGSDSALYRYCSYHCLDRALTKEEFFSFEEDGQTLIYDTNASGEVVTGANLFNEDSTAVTGVILNEKAHVVRSNIEARNGYIHKIDYWMPVWAPDPVEIRWDFLNSSDIIAYVNSWGASKGYGEIYSGAMSGTNRQLDLSKDCRDGDYGQSTLTSFTYEAKDAKAKTGSYRKVGYYKTKYVSSKDRTSNPYNAYHNDLLGLNLGYAGWFQMATPTIIKGKYKVTLRYASEATMKSFHAAGSPVKFQFDPEKGRKEYTKNGYVFKGLPTTGFTTGYGDCEIFTEIEFEESGSHTFKATMLDISAKTNGSYHMMWDYLLFTPITE